MREDYRKQIGQMIAGFRRGVFEPSEAARWILSYAVEATRIAEYIDILPTELRQEVVELLPTFPTTEEGWVVYDGVGQLDGNEHTWAKMVIDCRANIEAARGYFLCRSSPPVSADFAERIRAARLKSLAEFVRNGYRPPDEPAASGTV